MSNSTENLAAAIGAYLVTPLCRDSVLLYTGGLENKIPYRGATYDLIQSDNQLRLSQGITRDDLLSVIFLSVKPSPELVMAQMSSTLQDQFRDAINTVPLESDLLLNTRQNVLPLLRVLEALESSLCNIDGVDRVIGSKIIAHIWPKLWPIRDQVVLCGVNFMGSMLAMHIRALLLYNDQFALRVLEGWNYQHETLSQRTVLRNFDIALWMMHRNQHFDETRPCRPGSDIPSPMA